MNKNPDFDFAIQSLLEAISKRNLDTYKKYITQSEVMYTIVQNGYAFKTSHELITMHEEWFKNKDWIWEGTVIHKVVGTDMAMALIKYDYRAKVEDKPFSTWLTYVFRLVNNQWQIIHDHNTALDYYAFAKSAGLND